MAAMIFTAVRWFTRRHFVTFFRVHVLFAVATTAGTVMHGFGSSISRGQMPMALPGAGIWLVDILLRLLFMNGE
jgi:hypothetical protein